MADDGIVNQATSNQFEITIDYVTSIIAVRGNLESFEKLAPLRKNLILGNKLRVLHLMDLHNNKILVGSMCKIDRKTVRKVLTCLESSLLMRRKECLFM